MTNLSLIAAVDERGGLGKNNQLLCHLPADLQHFKTLTMGKPVVMGRKTYQSIGRPLPGRLNIVISRKMQSIEGVTTVNSIEAAIEAASDALEIMIIGGAELFAQTLSLVNRLYLTVIHHQFTADTFFPEIDLSAWDCESSVTRWHDERNPYDLTFYRYIKR